MKPGYITVTRRQSNNQWSGGIEDHPPPKKKKIRVQKPAGNVLTSIFWDQDSILLIDYLPKGQTVKAEYYSSLLVQLKDIMKEKFRENFTNTILRRAVWTSSEGNWYLHFKLTFNKCLCVA
jgi:hypothetical protein